MNLSSNPGLSTVSQREDNVWAPQSAYVVLEAIVVTVLLLLHGHVIWALATALKTAIGALFYRDTVQLLNQHRRTSHPCEITRRVSGTIERYLVFLCLFSILADLFFLAVASLSTR